MWIRSSTSAKPFSEAGGAVTEWNPGRHLLRVLQQLHPELLRTQGPPELEIQLSALHLRLKE